MGRHTLVVVGAIFAGNRTGFTLLNDRVGSALDAPANGEDLRDQKSAPLAGD
jgi:hypothetical protein